MTKVMWETCFVQSCPPFGLDRVNVLASDWYGGAFWI